MELSEDSVSEFRDYFTKAMRVCVKHGFTVEESFGMIWEETLEEVALSEPLQARVYEDLILWAKKWKNEVIPNSYSQKKSYSSGKVLH
jgi:hypothetical protein